MLYVTNSLALRRNPSRRPARIECQRCGRDIRPGSHYLVRTWRTTAMPASAYEYSCTKHPPAGLEWDG